MKSSAYGLVSLLAASSLLACGGATGNADGNGSTGGGAQVSTGGAGTGGAGVGGAGTGGAGIGGAGTGGAGTGGGTTLDCSPISPCGGDLPGRWRVVDYCPPTQSTYPECNGLITDESVLSDFFWVFESDGSFRVEGLPVLTVDQSATEACAQAAGYADAAAYCAEASEPTGGDTTDGDPVVTTTCSLSDGSCSCHSEIQPPDMLPEPQPYEVNAGVLTLGSTSEHTLEGAYCVTGSSLRIATSQYGSAILLVRE